jgi:hypothetical protein
VVWTLRFDPDRQRFFMVHHGIDVLALVSRMLAMLLKMEISDILMVCTQRFDLDRQHIFEKSTWPVQTQKGSSCIMTRSSLAAQYPPTPAHLKQWLPALRLQVRRLEREQSVAIVVYWVCQFIVSPSGGTFEYY